MLAPQRLFFGKAASSPLLAGSAASLGDARPQPSLGRLEIYLAYCDSSSQAARFFAVGT